jgi:hypothetical protein
MIVKGLHERCIAVEVIGSTKTILTPRIQLCPSDPTLPFKLSRRPFPIKISFAVTTSEAHGQIHHRQFFHMANAMWHFLDLPHLTMSLLQLLKGIDNV